MGNNKRIESLDWLRGLMALSIMIYHYISWLFFEIDASTFWGRLGIYGVSIFFILSGLSMAISYNKYIRNIKTSLYFLIRRIFRIWPLLWAVIFIIVIYSILFQKPTYSVGIIILNLTTMFGIVITFYKMNFNFPKIIKYQLEHLGIATYSIYLLHPIVFLISNNLFVILFNLTNPVLNFILAIASTIIVSLVSYKYFETPFINLGKKLTSS